MPVYTGNRLTVIEGKSPNGGKTAVEKLIKSLEQGGQRLKDDAIHGPQKALH